VIAGALVGVWRTTQAHQKHQRRVRVLLLPSRYLTVQCQDLDFRNDLSELRLLTNNRGGNIHNVVGAQRVDSFHHPSNREYIRYHASMERQGRASVQRQEYN
jgi:hypothetical protein